MPRKPHAEVQVGFEKETRRIAIADIQPLKVISPAIKKSPKYAQIVASIDQIGIVELPIVAPDRKDCGKYLLLDGHLRLEALKDKGETEVACLISLEDEAFTYNKRVNRIAIIQEHRMIIKAIERGVSDKPKAIKGLTTDQMALMERETANLDREFRIAEQSYGIDHLDLVIASGYIGKLLGNAKVVRYLGLHQKEILLEFQKLVELEAAAA